MQISKQDLNRLETLLDRLWSVFNIDIEFTRHFHDRVNDTRNKKPITLPELQKIFRDAFQKYGKGFAKNLSRDEVEAVLTDISTDINIPFVLKYDHRNQEIDLVSKTVMRKKGFKTRNKKYLVSQKLLSFKEFIHS